MNDKLIKQIQEDFLNEHNCLRKIHGFKPFKLSQPLCKEATAWAQECVANKKLTYCDSIDQNVTENLIVIPGEYHDHDAYQFVISWYSTIESFDFNEADFIEKVSSFMPIIWKNGDNIGVGVAMTFAGDLYIVVRYGHVNISKETIKQNVSILSKKEKTIYGLLDTHNISELMLKIHNKIRRLHHSTDLTWSEDLSKSAEAISSKEADPASILSSRMVFGINYWKGEYLPNAYRICAGWYKTYIHHNYKTEKKIPESMPFCQMVWSETSVMGCAISKVQETYIVVALYSLAGNINRMYEKNVKKPAGSKYYEFYK